MNLPTAALNKQVELIEWLGTPFGKRYCESYGRVMEAEGAMLIDSNEFGRLTKAGMDRAETFAVTDEITELLSQASHSIPDYPLHPEDLPAQVGFVYLQDSIVIPDRVSNSIVVSAIMWMSANIAEGDYKARGPDGILFVLLTDMYDPRDTYSSKHLAIRKEIQENGWSHPPLWPLIGGSWRFGEPPLVYANDDHRVHVQTFMMSFFRFVQEPFIEMRSMVADRAARRRLVRIARPVPEIRVVRLRQTVAKGTRSEGDPEPQVWSHRWIVRGHWRRQWYPSQERHAPVWIVPHVKGPADRPLIVKDKVFYVNR